MLSFVTAEQLYRHEVIQLDRRLAAMASVRARREADAAARSLSPASPARAASRPVPSVLRRVAGAVKAAVQSRHSPWSRPAGAGDAICDEACAVA